MRRAAGQAARRRGRRLAGGRHCQRAFGGLRAAGRPVAEGRTHHKDAENRAKKKKHRQDALVFHPDQNDGIDEGTQSTTENWQKVECHNFE